MSSIGGPGGIGGPKGPTGPGAAPAADALDEVAAEAPVEGAEAPSGTADIDALATEVAAGRLTPHEALERLVDATAGPDIGPADRAELRELLADMVANDPYLAALSNRI